jgi:hypothetical protein
VKRGGWLKEVHKENLWCILEREVMVVAGVWPNTLIVPSPTWEGVYQLFEDGLLEEVTRFLEAKGILLSSDEVKTANFVEESLNGVLIYEYRPSDSSPPQILRVYPAGGGYYDYELAP